MGDDPPFLPVGTEVSAKYKGAFCEAKIRKVVKNIKCKVLFKAGNQSVVLSDEHIRGTLRVGAQVEARHPDKNQFLESIVTKIQDCSQYTVVFDDGDITTLRRSALCLKSGRHFAESETLDQLPLTHPEHFGTPVVGGRRGRRSLQTQEDSSDEDEDSVDSSRQERGTVVSGSGEREPDIGKVVIVEVSDKKKGKEPWFPGLVVAPTAQDAVTIRIKDEYLVRSFRDGRYYTVPKKEASDFTRETVAKTDNAALKAAVEKALLYLDREELPPHWDRDVLFGLDDTSSIDDSKADSDAASSDEETREAKDHFVAQLYKFMDDRGTPINKAPTIFNRDLDLYRLYKVVTKLGGFNRVNNQNAWKIVTQKMLLSGNSAVNLIKQAYKKYLHSFEDFYRKLGCTMHSPSQPARPRGSRSLLREKDRAASASGASTPKREPEPEPAEKAESPPEEEVKRRTPLRVPKKLEETEDTSGEDSELSGRSQRVPRAKRVTEEEVPETKGRKRTKTKEEGSESETKLKVKEEEEKEKEKEKEKKQKNSTPKEGRVKVRKSEEAKGHDSRKRERDETLNSKKRGRKPRGLTESEESDGCRLPSYVDIQVGDKLRVYYGNENDKKVTYEAKVNEVRQEGNQKLYLVHYTGWNTRYDEWIKRPRVAENLSWTPGRRRSQGSTPTGIPPPSLSRATPTRPLASFGSSKRGKPRTNHDTSRSTTPSSVASSSSIGPRSSAHAPPATSENEAPPPETNRRRSRRISEMSAVTDADSEDSSEEEESPNPGGTPKRRGKKLTNPVGLAGDSPSEGLAKKRVSRRRKEEAEASSTPAPSQEAVETGKEKDSVPEDEKPDESEPESELNKEEDSKGKDLDPKKIRSELKAPEEVPSSVPVIPEPGEDSLALPELVETSGSAEVPPEVVEAVTVKQDDDVYEFREPEPFKFEISPFSAERFARKPARDSESEKSKAPDEDVPEPVAEVESPEVAVIIKQEAEVTEPPEVLEKPIRPPVIVPAFVPQVMPALSTLARSMIPIPVLSIPEPEEAVEEPEETVEVKEEEELPANEEEKNLVIVEDPPMEKSPEEEVLQLPEEAVEIPEATSGEEQPVETVVETVIEETQIVLEAEPVLEEVKEEASDKPEENQEVTRRQSVESGGKAKTEEEYEMSSLLCEETIPGSPVTQVPAGSDPGESSPLPSTSGGSASAEEIPFASAPTASVIRGVRDSARPIRKRGLREVLAMQQQQLQQQQQQPTSAVIDNTPPTTPEESPSSASNTPEGGMSPEHESSQSSGKKSDNESADAKPEPMGRNLGPRASATLLPVPIIPKRKEEELPHGKEEESPMKKKRRGPDSAVKRNRGYGRSPRRTGSDSEDFAESSPLGLGNSLSLSHSVGKASRYNFCMELDPELDASQRISVLQEKMRQLRETYMSLKTQVATLDRRKKKIRRKEREEKSSKEVTAC